MRTVLAADQLKIRSALKALLKEEPDQKVVGEAVDVDTLMTLVQRTHPDLVMLDWELTDGEFAVLLANLKSQHPGLKVIALSGRPEKREAVLAAGADAFIWKGEPPDHLLEVLSALSTN